MTSCENVKKTSKIDKTLRNVARFLGGFFQIWRFSKSDVFFRHGVRINDEKSSKIRSPGPQKVHFLVQKSAPGPSRSKIGVRISDEKVRGVSLSQGKKSKKGHGVSLSQDFFSKLRGFLRSAATRFT